MGPDLDYTSEDAGKLGGWYPYSRETKLETVLNDKRLWEKIETEENQDKAYNRVPALSRLLKDDPYAGILGRIGAIRISRDVVRRFVNHRKEYIADLNEDNPSPFLILHGDIGTGKNLLIESIRKDVRRQMALYGGNVFDTVLYRDGDGVRLESVLAGEGGRLVDKYKHRLAMTKTGLWLIPALYASVMAYANWRSGKAWIKFEKEAGAFGNVLDNIELGWMALSQGLFKSGLTVLAVSAMIYLAMEYMRNRRVYNNQPFVLSRYDEPAPAFTPKDSYGDLIGKRNEGAKSPQNEFTLPYLVAADGDTLVIEDMDFISPKIQRALSTITEKGSFYIAKQPSLPFNCEILYLASTNNLGGIEDCFTKPDGRGIVIPKFTNLIDNVETDEPYVGAFTKHHGIILLKDWIDNKKFSISPWDYDALDAFAEGLITPDRRKMKFSRGVRELFKHIDMLSRLEGNKRVTLEFINSLDLVSLEEELEEE